MVNSLEYDYKSQANNKSMFETPKLKQSQSYYKYDDNKNTLKSNILKFIFRYWKIYSVNQRLRF